MSILDLVHSDDARDARDGGPAFPKMPDDFRNGSAGMSLRDWFAGQALNGFLATDAQIAGPSFDAVKAKIARMAYEYADAMLATREASR